MPSDPAEPSNGAARPSGAGGFLRVIPLVLLALLALTACDRDVEITPPEASGTSSGARAEEAQQSLDALVGSLEAGERVDAQGTAAEGSEDLLGWIHDNARALEVDELTMRYVDEGAALDQRLQNELGPEAWRGTLQVTYAFGGFDEQPSRLETSAVFVPDGDEVRIASFGEAGTRTPLWLTGELSVVRTGRTLVAVAGSTAGRYPGLVRGAVRQVGRVLPDWTGPLVVEVPGSQAELDAALQAPAGEYDNIAAVTTTEDGSLAPGAPVRVFVNPGVFGRLKSRGAQVVMSHESTHVAVGATFASMPTWLLEGFADFVALDDAGVPLSLAAGQILAEIREDGLPDGLPTTEDLDPTASGLGATYEEAWLACRYLAEQYGARALVRFYRSVDGGTPPKQAFAALGTTEREFVAGWRDDLARLAGVTG